MHRVVITGLGIVSPLGNDAETVLESLREGRSGIRFRQDYKDAGLNCHVAGTVSLDAAPLIDRKHLRFMGNAAAYAYLAMQQAIEDASIPSDLVSSPGVGVIAGSGGASTSNEIVAVDTLRRDGIRRVSPFVAPRIMGSTVSANLSTAFGIKGLSYSISSACSTSAHCIGHAYEQIREGRQQIIFAGGGEEEHWSLCMFFDAMRAASMHYNDRPESASRPYDANRDGLVIAGGGGIVVVEELEHALARGAKIYAEIVGYGANSDGADMVAPSGEGAVRCMAMAVEGLDAPIDYINTHGTSTPVGDVVELDAIRTVFGERVPKISSTKSLSGHSLGATGVHETIYCLLMMEHNFIAASANIEHLDPRAEGMPIVRERIDNAGLRTVLSNSFGFGGTNAALVFQCYTG